MTSPLHIRLARIALQARRRERLWMLACLATVLILITLCGVARGQDGPRTTVSTRVDQSACRELERAAEGQPEPARLSNGTTVGMWFPMPTARLVLCEVQELRLRRQEAALYGREVEIRDQMELLLREQVGLAVLAEDRLKAVVSASERRARDAERDRDAWFRAPWFLVTVGIVLTIGLEVAAVAVLAQL